MFKEQLLKWALQLVLQQVLKYLTPEKLEAGRKAVADFLLKQAKDLTPDFKWDDVIAEHIMYPEQWLTPELLVGAKVAAVKMLREVSAGAGESAKFLVPLVEALAKYLGVP